MPQDKLPRFSKKFSDLLPWSRRLLSATKTFFLRAAVTGTSTIAVAQGFLPNVDRPVPGPVAIVNREKKSSIGKLILRLGNAYDNTMFAGHRSHSSHSSHRSHSSHSSHYSSSRGSGSSPSSTPPPAPSTPPPAPSTPPSSSGTSSSGPKPKAPAAESFYSRPTAPETAGPTELLEAVLIKLTKVDLEQHLLIGRDRRKVELTFHYTPETKIRQTSPPETVYMVSDFPQNYLPLVPDQEVLIAWKSNSKAQRIAVMITTH